MIDALLLVLVLLAAAAGGLAVLRLMGALPEAEDERGLVGLAVGLGLAGALGLALAAVSALRPAPLGVAAALALALGGRDLVFAVRAAIRATNLRSAWPFLLVCAVVLAVEATAMLAPPIGGDQTKYHLVYPRLYAERGGLVATPWSFWGQMQFLPNFLFAIGFALRGDVLARFLNAMLGVLAALALSRLVGRRLGGPGAVAGALFFTLPITFSLMTRAGADLAVVLYGALAASALLDWMDTGRASDLRLVAVTAGLAGGSKVMGLLVPALAGLVVVVVLLRSELPVRRALGPVLAFGLLAFACASPCYVRNAVDTGNPLYPFGYSVFGGRHWSRAASEYLADYYEQYQTTYAARRDGAPYAGVELARFPWDLTMHPESFENAARQSLDVGPFALAFLPAVLLVRRRRRAVLLTAALGVAYASVIATAAWAHPRYVVPGVALALAAAVPAARTLLGARVFAAVVALTVAGNLALTSRLLRPLWSDQVRVATGRLAPNTFLRRHSPRFAFWERANAAIPPDGRVLVLEKVPHPYYIERPYVLASYLEQGLVDYRALREPAALATAARALGVTHVALDVSALDASGDPFETDVARLWRGFVGSETDLVLRADGFALYALRPASAFAARKAAARG